MVKTSPDGDDYANPHFRSNTLTTLTPDQFEVQYEEAAAKIKQTFLQYQREGSGWQIDEVLHLTLNVAVYKPLSGSSYLPLPKKIKDKKAVLNIQNDDQKCFLWSVLAAKHPIHWRDNANLLSHYQRYERELNMQGIKYPVSINQVGKFEKQNSDISINIFGYAEHEISLHVNHCM